MQVQAENPKQQYLLLKALNEVITSLTAHTTLPDRQQDEVWPRASAGLPFLVNVNKYRHAKNPLHTLFCHLQRLVSTDDSVTRSHIHRLSTTHRAHGCILALLLGPAHPCFLDHVSVALPQPAQLDAVPRLHHIVTTINTAGCSVTLASCCTSPATWHTAKGEVFIVWL